MLARDGDRSSDRQRQRTASADRVVQDGVDATQKRASKCWQAGAEQLVQRLDFIDATNMHGATSRSFVGYSLRV